MTFRHKSHLVSVIFLALMYSSCANDSKAMPDFWADIDPNSQQSQPQPPPDNPGKPDNPTPPDLQPECTESVCANETTLNECVDGKFVEKDCTKDGGTCKDNACQAAQEPSEKCTESHCKSETVLASCVDGVEKDVDCSEKGQICKEDACIDDPEQIDTTCTISQCKEDGFTLKQCVEGHFTTVDCSADGQLCVEGTCVNPPNPDVVCTESVCAEDGTTLKLCMDGMEITVDCSQTERICSEGACSEPPIPCTEEDIGCEGNTLILCVDGFIQKTDCEGQNKDCVPSTLSCEYQCDETTPLPCLTASTKEVCSDHRIKTEECGENMICSGESCIPNPCAACKESQICIGGECKDTPPDSLIGIPCSCNSADCFDTVTGAQFKSLFTGLVRIALSVYLDKIDDNDKIVFPKFTSPSNIGCEPLAAVVPEGMEVLCLRDADVIFPESIIQFVSEDAEEIMAKVNIENATISKMLPMMSELMKNGIHFTSPNGYCMTGAIDISGTIDQSPASYAINTNALQKGGLIDKINFGDHAKVQEVLQSPGMSATNYCPEGSTLLTYTISKTLSKVGHFDIGSDLCLKTCQSDADCREGYSCIEMPATAPIEEAETRHVCFDENNVSALSLILGKE